MEYVYMAWNIYTWHYESCSVYLCNICISYNYSIPYGCLNVHTVPILHCILFVYLLVQVHIYYILATDGVSKLLSGISYLVELLYFTDYKDIENGMCRFLQN